MKRSRAKTFTARQEAAILQLYCHQQLSGAVVAKRLHLEVNRVYLFLRRRRALRPRGYHVAKLSPAERKQLERELLTTQDAVLARRYGLVRDRVRQIRAELGYPSSQVLRHKLTLRAQAERRERRQIEREHRQQQQRKAELIAMNQLSRRWKSGTTIRELAKECGLVWGCLNSRIVRWRQRYPQKFPYRLPPPPRPKTI